MSKFKKYHTNFLNMEIKLKIKDKILSLLFILFLLNTSLFAANEKIYLPADIIKGTDGKSYDRMFNPINGILHVYYKSGELELQLLFQNGEQNGITKAYYKSGILKQEIPYTDGKANGIERVYYESGRLKWERPFNIHKIHGILKYYYKSGALSSETPFINGKKDGLAKQYYESGEIWLKITHKNGKAISGFSYTKDGMEIKITKKNLSKMNK